jgi:hypothetical protein
MTSPVLAELWRIPEPGTRGAAPVAVYPITVTPSRRDPEYVKAVGGPHWFPHTEKVNGYIWILTIDGIPVAERIQLSGTLDLKTGPSKRDSNGYAKASDYPVFIRWELNTTRAHWEQTVAEWREKAALALGRSPDHTT